MNVNITADFGSALLIKYHILCNIISVISVFYTRATYYDGYTIWCKVPVKYINTEYVSLYCGKTYVDVLYVGV